MVEVPEEFVEKGVDALGDLVDYSIRLTRLVDGDTTYDLVVGDRTLQFSSHSAALEHVKQVQREHDVRAVLEAVGFSELLTRAHDGDVPEDVRRLVIAAREVAFCDDGAEAKRELDAASEAFAARVPWDDEPDEK